VSFLCKLEPVELWTYFDQILCIPRGSKNEHAICQFVSDVARRNNLEYIQDAIGDVIVSKPAAAGFEKAPITILQCHLDMVNEKNRDVEHDFTQDPILPRRDGEFLTAQGTTLGADNGIGIAACLAVMENRDLQHGPLECLFTVDEETGLTGAQQLSQGMLKGSLLVNLDSEEEGAIYVGCAGGADVDLQLPVERRPVEKGWTHLRLWLQGLKGGHSGIDIHLQRGNAIRLLARMLYSVSSSQQFRICEFSGGNMRNALPRESSVVIALPEEKSEFFWSEIDQRFQEISAEYKAVDPGMKLSIEQTESKAECLSEESQVGLFGLVLGLPHGVISMSNDIPNLVETSTNLAKVRLETNHLLVHVSNRSSVETALDALQNRIAAVAALAKAEIRCKDGYPGWKPDLDSELLGLTRKVYEEVLGIQPEVKAIHAGLECGIIKKKYPALDMVSIGPRIEFPHSPDERVHIDSVSRFYRLLTGLLAEIARIE